MTDSDHYPPAQYREHVEGRGIRDPDGHSHAPLVRDSQVSRYLSVVENHYEPAAADQPGKMPGQARDLEEVQRIRATESTETGRMAMENGDMTSLKAMTGDSGQQADVSGLKAIGKVDDLVLGPAPVIIILGEMGHGKTDFAGLLAQRRNAALDGEHLVGTNIASLREKTRWVDGDGEVQDGYIPNYGTLNEWVQQDGDPLEHDQRPKTFIGDEFSSSARGSGKQGYEVAQKMAPLIYKIRKYGGALIYIAHGPKSIQPLMWRVGTIVKKTSKKSAVVADSIKGGSIADIEFEIDGIPPTDWRFATEEASNWSWSETGEDSDETDGDDRKRVAMWTIRECIEVRDMSPRETSNFVPYSHTTCKNWYEDYQDGGEKADWVSQVEAEIA